MQYKESSAAGRIFRKFLPAFLILLVVLSLSLTALAATAYEVTKSGGALVRKSYAESADSVYRASQGSILWVNKSKVNSSGNTWYQLTDGYWIFSGNVKKHTCTGTWVSGYNPTCTAAGVHNYRCNKCGNSWSHTTAAWGHSYDGNVCTRCGVWNASSLKSRSYINKVLYVTTNGAKVHSGPYGATSTVTTLNRGTNITATEKLVNASNNVWYRYSGGYIFSDYVVDHSSCSWNSGTVTQKATCTQVGIRVQNCTICGAGRSVAIAKTSHKYSGNICTVCGTWNTSSLKSKTTINNVNYCVITTDAKIRTGPYEGCSVVSTPAKGTDVVVTQKVVNASGNTWYKCSGGYIFSGHVTSHASCKWNSGTVTKKATCTATGTKVYKCTLCGKSKTSTIAKTSHKYSSHVCTACGTWDTSSLKSKTTINNVKYYVKTSGAKVHSGPYSGAKTVKTLSKGTEITVTQKVVNASKNTWYRYSGGYIFEDYVVAHGSCKWNSGTVTKKATCTATGTKVYKCTICGKSKTSTIAKVSHKYSDHVCKSCGAWDTSSLKSKTTINNVKYYVKTSGAKVHSGPYSGAKTVKTLSKGTNIVVTQKVVNASRNTWYKCSDGYIFGDYVVAHNSCKWSSATVTKKATCTTAGTKTQKCTICGKSKNTTIAKLGHKYSGHVCKTCGAWDTSSLKSKATVKNVKYYVLTDGAKVHSGPYAKCKTVKKLSKGTIITVTQKVVNASKNTWYKYSGGYIFEDYVIDYALYTAKTTLNATSATLYVDQAKTLKATVKGPSSKVTWKTSDKSVATVSSSGKITAKKAGTCTITATANGKKATCKITVKQLAAPTSVKFTASARSFKVSHKAVSGADGYEVLYSAVGESNAKAYTGTSASVTVAAGKNHEYSMRVRAYKLIGGKKYYGKVSSPVKVHVHNAAKNTSTTYSPKDYTYHSAASKFSCQGCKKYFTQTVSKKHSFVCGVCQTCGKKKGAEYSVAKFYPGEGTGPAYAKPNSSGKRPISVAVKFNDKLFTGSSSTFSKELCKISAAGAAASYTVSLGEAYLESCGFDYVEHANSSSSKSTKAAGKNDHARYIIGYKKLAGTNTTLVGVLVNGYTTGGYEWISNFNVGKSGLHEGFSKAADEIYAKVNSYIKSKKINTSNIKLWVTGHSRGGAVTGMVAVKLNEKYGSKNVFAYGFATPNGVPNDIAKKTYSGNIFNIVNPGDFVPYVVPTSWDFTKFGTTYEISVSSTGKSYYKTMSQDSYGGMSVSERKELISAFCKLSPNRAAYYKTAKNGSSPSDFGRAIGLFKSSVGLSNETLDLLTGCIGKQGSGSTLWNLVTGSQKIAEAHFMETYLAMVYDKYE